MRLNTLLCVLVASSQAAVLKETFPSLDGWVPSLAKKQDETELQFDGEWKVEEPSVLKVIDGDYGLVAKSAAKHHGISKKLEEVFETGDDKSLVLQYEVKMQNGLECGGAYIKLFTKGEGEFNPEELHDKTPYTVMFGPDRCGSTNKVHFIFRHKNPLTGDYQEKHLKSSPSATISKESNLYTLIVRPDNSFEILVNQESVAKGNLLEDFDPSVNPSKTVDDLTDKKPDDWVDEATIADPEAKKPEDWDEEAPLRIIDSEAKKPEGWLEDEPDTVPDPEAKKPEDWEDEDDGEWLAPEVPNPQCSIGCGKWDAPLIPNPDYKGPWSAPRIPNPEYKGEWKPHQIPNPAYFEDKHPHRFEPIGAVGFEIWTMQSDLLFDNIYLGYSEQEAKEFAKETFEEKRKLEVASKQEEKVETEDPSLTELIKNLDFASAYAHYPKTVSGSLVAFGSALIFAAVYLLLSLFKSPEFKEDEASDVKEAEQETSEQVNDETELIDSQSQEIEIQEIQLKEDTTVRQRELTE